MIYSFITLNTILFMAKFIMKTTINSTTNIMLSLSLKPVITTKNGMKIGALIVLGAVTTGQNSVMFDIFIQVCAARKKF